MAKKIARRHEGCLFKRGATWYVRWQYDGKVRVQSTGKTDKKEADAVRRELLAPYLAGDRAAVQRELVEAAKSAEVVAEERMAKVREEEARIPLAEAWKRHPYTVKQPGWGRTAGDPLSQRNIHENELAWQKFVDWFKRTHKAGMAMQDVRAEDAEAYKKYLAGKGLTKSRQRVLLMVCNVMFRLAGISSPFAEVHLPKAQKAESREAFSKEQVRRMLGAASGEWKGFLAVLYHTGVRAGDGVLLTHRNRVMVPDGKGGMVRRIRGTAAKTGADIDVLESPELTRILDEVLDRHPTGKLAPLFPTLAAEYREKGSAALSRRFEAFMARALGEWEEGEDGEQKFVPFVSVEERAGGVRSISRFGLHSFRHAMATEAARAGVPQAAVQKVLGHSSPSITAIYQKHANEAEQRRLLTAVSLESAEEEGGAIVLPVRAAGVSGAILGAVRDIVAAASGMSLETWEKRRMDILATCKWLEKELQDGAAAMKKKISNGGPK